MIRRAARDRSCQHLRHALGICQRDLDRRGHDAGDGPLRLSAIGGLHQRDQGGHGRVLFGQAGPAQRGNVAGGRHLGQAQVRRRNDGARIAFAQGDAAVLGVQHADHLLPRGKVAPAPVGQVAVGDAGLDLLHHDVLVVHPGGRQPPGKAGIAPRQDRGNAGDRPADDAARLQVHPRQVPQRRRRQRDMGVVGQQRCACGRPLGRSGEGVGGGAAAHAHVAHQRRKPVRRRFLGRGHEARAAAEQRRIGRQRRLAHAARQIACPLRHRQRDARPRHLGRDLPRGPCRHQLQDRQRIRRLPIGDVAGHQEELGRTASQGALVYLLDPGIHPVRIGLQRGAGRLVLRLQRGLGVPPQPQPAGKVVGGIGAFAEHLGQPPLRRAPQNDHLEQAILRMGESQREEGVVIGSGQDVGDVLGRADDLDPLLDPRQRQLRVIVRQRADGEIPGQHRRPDEADHQADGQPDQPAKQREHEGRRSLKSRGAG